MANTDSRKTLLTQLKNPFDPRLVKWRVGGGGKQFAYVDARDVMKRLDEVMGVDGWSDKYTAVDGGFICELSLKIGDEWITKSNGSNNTKVEPVKGGISSALKRAAVNWGIGRYLYYIPNDLQRKDPSDWPTIFLPGAPENWEDIAEMEAEINTGMDEEDSAVVKSAIDYIVQIQAAANAEELDKILEDIPADQRLLFADAIANKRATF